MEDRYVILSALHKVAGPFARYFWLLGKVEYQGVKKEISIIEAIHGLASTQCFGTDHRWHPYKLQRTGGASTCISAFRVPAPTNRGYVEASANTSLLTLTDTQYWVEPDETRIIYDGYDSKARWDRAVRHLKIINDKREPYSKLGVGSLGFLNGNTVYCVVAALMEIKPHIFDKYISPGMGSGSVNHLLPDRNIQRLLAADSLNTTQPIFSLHEEQYIIQAGVTAAANLLPKPGNKRSNHGHHFLLLKKRANGHEEILEAIHGLPSDFLFQQSQWPASPGIRHQYKSLWAHCMSPPSEDNRVSGHPVRPASDPWIVPEQLHTVYGARPLEQDAQRRWQYAIDYVTILNGRMIPYCPNNKKAFSFFKQSKRCIDGNSIYCALSEVMGITPYHFAQYSKAGFNTIIVPQDDVDALVALASQRAHKNRGVNSSRLTASPSSEQEQGQITVINGLEPDPSMYEPDSSVYTEPHNNRRVVTFIEEEFEGADGSASLFEEERFESAAADSAGLFMGGSRFYDGFGFSVPRARSPTPENVVHTPAFNFI